MIDALLFLIGTGLVMTGSYQLFGGQGLLITGGLALCWIASLPSNRGAGG